MKYQVAQYSLRGGRPANEDRVGVAERDNAALMILADGLGGHSGGALAAEALVQTLLHAFQSVRQTVITNPSAFLALGIVQAHKAIVRLGRSHNPPLEPRTTCVACLVQNGYAYWAHVGDSRLYHFRNCRVIERTQDHSAIEQLRHDGVISEEEMAEHPQKGRLLKCVGGPHEPSISLGRETLLNRGDVLLLCSDGLWEALPPEELGRYLRRDSLEEDIEEMLHAAETRMGRGCDNVSAVGLRWEDQVSASPPLQGDAPAQVDQQTLREGAARGTVLKQRGKKKPRADKERHETLDSGIKELEEYLKRFEPK